MTRRLLVAVHLVMVVQARGYFPHAFLLWVAIAVGVMLLAVPSAVVAILLPIFLVTEPGTLGTMAVAAHRYLELDSRSATALHVSPLRSGEYLLALVVASALLAVVAGVITFAAVLGLDGRLLWLTPVIFAFAVASGLLGFALSLRYPDFPRFMLGSVPVMAIWQLPLLAVYDLVPTAAVAWVPSAPGIFALAALCRGPVAVPAIAGLAAAGVAVAVAGFALVHRLYERRLRAGWEFA